MISIVVLTFNEAVNLERCLASVAWSDDVLVLDSGSTDDTRGIASRAGARVLERPFDSFAGQRNYAMEAGSLRHDWVLHLDADEVVPAALVDELSAIVSSGAVSYPVYRVASRLIFQGTWLRWAGAFPAYQVRFGRREQLRFVDHGHGQREVQSLSEVGTLTTPLDHFNFSKGVNDWMRRHIGYAAAEALMVREERLRPLNLLSLIHRDPTIRRRVLKRLANRVPFRPFFRFLYVAVFSGGFLDGAPGLRYALLMSAYQHLIDLNLSELESGDINLSRGLVRDSSEHADHTQGHG